MNSMIALRSANCRLPLFFQWVSQGHASEFVNGASWLSSGLPSPAFAAYGGAQCQGETPLRAHGSNDLYADFFSRRAKRSLTHGGS